MGKDRAPPPKIIDPGEYTFSRVVQVGLDDLIGSVVKVDDGRGFVIAVGDKRYVITAAHCLPSLPPPILARHLEEETYPGLIGPLGEDPSVTAACVFIDQMADIAVLGEPDNQAMSDEHGQYEAFFSLLPPFDIAAPPLRARLRVPAVSMGPLPKHRNRARQTFHWKARCPSRPTLCRSRAYGSTAMSGGLPARFRSSPRSW
jgi:hypothetical protein